MDLLLIGILLAFVAWGLYGLVTNQVHGCPHWADWPEVQLEDDPDLKAACDRWAAREARKARAAR